jgi:hypothetical protein
LVEKAGEAVMLNFKKLLVLIICFAVVFTTHIPHALAETSPPIAQGKTKKYTYIYWGKSEAYPTIVSLSSGEAIDIYEYDSEWVMTKYKTWVTYNGRHTIQEFYGYVMRKDVICNPPLKGEKSKKAETGPGKRKGRPPKRKKPGDTSTPGETTPEEATPQPDKPDPPITIEDLMEYDWIIRTPGVCKQIINLGDGVKFKAQFSLMAMKFGGYTASSLPVFNDGKHNSYVGYASFSLDQKMKDVLDEKNLDFLEGLGGISIDSYNSDARFYLDSQTDDGTKAIITINMIATSALNPQIIDEYMGITVGGDMFEMTQNMPLDIRIEPSGSGYQMVLLNMKPGGGDLKFPAMLEKFPLSDIDKAERERAKKEKEEEALRRAKELQKKAIEDWKKELREKFDDESDDPTKEGEVKTDDSITIAPLVPPEDGDSSSDRPAVVPLVPSEDGDNSDDSSVVVSVAPLTGGGTSEEVDYFPDEN